MVQKASSPQIASDEAKTEIISLSKKLEKSERQVDQLKRASEEQDEALASGDDELWISGKFSNIHPFSFFDPDRDKSIPEIKIAFSLGSTWNKLIGFFGTKEAREWDSGAVERWLSNLAEEVAQKKGVLIPQDAFKEVSVTWKSDEIYKVTNQLVALGMLTSRSRTGWALTSKGELHASRQLALRKGEITLKDREWCQIKVENK